MTLLSSAIKGVPEDTIEAARIDGATEWQIFWKVVLPQIKGTTITVFITVLILVLKVFDIVYVLTNGRFNTQRDRQPVLPQAVQGRRQRHRLGDRRRAAAGGHAGADLPGPALPRRGGEPMTSDTFSTEAGMSGTTSVPEDKPRRVRGLMKDGRRRSWASILTMVVPCPSSGQCRPSACWSRRCAPASTPSQSGWWTVIWPGNWSDSGFTFEQLQRSAQQDQPQAGHGVHQQRRRDDPRHRDPDHVRRVRGVRVHLHGLPRQGRAVHRDRRGAGDPDPGGVPADARAARPQRHLDITGQYFAVWLLHTGFGMPLAIYTLRNYMSTLPKTVIESAKIDGASHFQTFWRLIVPMSVPALAAFAILQFLWVWNDLLIAKLFLGSGDNGTVIVAVQGLLGTQGQGQELLTAGGVHLDDPADGASSSACSGSSSGA